MYLVLGGKSIAHPLEYLRAYRHCRRQDTGAVYLDRPSNPDTIGLDDVGMSVLMNSQATATTARTVVLFGADMAKLLALVPKGVNLEDPAAPQHFGAIADLIEAMTTLGREETPAREKGDPLGNGIGISRATKMIHLKRPGLIPVLDNEAIFDLYCGTKEAEEKVGRNSRPYVEGGTVKGRELSGALAVIRADLLREENKLAWRALATEEPRWTRLQHLDAVWWIHSEPARMLQRMRRDKKTGPIRRDRCAILAGADQVCPYACVGLAPP